MLRPDPARLNAQTRRAQLRGSQPVGGQAPGLSVEATDGGTLPNPSDIDIQQELNKLEELILASPRVPFSGRTLIDEDQLLDQLDAIRLNLPPAFRQAVQLLQQRSTLIAEAERYAHDLIAAAEQQAAEMLDELGIVRQAEQMAQQIKTQAQQDCDGLRTQVMGDIEQMQFQAQRDWEAMRQKALAEQDLIQQEADTYADQVLLSVEQQLTQMLRIIQNGRGHLQPTQDAPTPALRTKGSKSSPAGSMTPDPRGDRLRSPQKPMPKPDNQA
jgi:cell division septum initiation protein DivIVA